MTPPFALVPAAYVLLLREGPSGPEALLQQRLDTGYMDGHWVAGAAGHVEPGETATRCAVREAREELGVGIDEADLQLLTVMQRRRGDDAVEQRVDWYFATRRWSGEPAVQEPAKCAGLRWTPLGGLDDLPGPVPAYERRVLEGLGAGDPAAADQPRALGPARSSGSAAPGDRRRSAAAPRPHRSPPGARGSAGR